MPTPPLHFADRVRALSRDTGTGPLELAEALPGHRSFADAGVPVGSAFHYAIAGLDDARQWEVGVGSLSETGRLIRRPTASSAGPADAPALVAFAPGRKAVSLTVGAGWYAGQGAPALAEIEGLADALSALQPAGDYQPAGAYAPAAHSHADLPLTGGTLSGALAVASTQPPRSALDVRGSITGGFGAPGQSGSLDWSAAEIARSGVGAFALRGSNPNGPGGTAYYYSLSFEFGGTYDGSGPLTQFAIPRTEAGAPKVFYRLGSGRTSMEPWRAFLLEDTLGRFTPGKDNVNPLGAPTERFSHIFVGSGTISTSDARAKSKVGPIPEAWLDAWEAVAWCRYRLDGGRRAHAGLVAQAVRDAFAARGIDAADLGLLCHDEWPEERDEDGVVVRAAGDRWGLRYDECFALEAASTRRRLDRLEARFARLEAALAGQAALAGRAE